MLFNPKYALAALILSLLFSCLSMAQTLNFQAGTSYSKLSWETGAVDMKLFNEVSIAFNGFVGLDYLDKQYFNLSSNVGLLRKGGQAVIEILDDEGLETGETKMEKATLDYLTFNTLFDIKYPIKEKIIPFISVGPRLDYLVNSSKELETLDKMNALNSISYGLLLGGGLKYNLANLQLGLRADYYLNFNKVAEWPAETGNLGGEVSDQTFTINLVVGYRLN